ncbi:MAG TPA: hypothetical protein EYP43_00110 [Thermoplasmata archaeon]|nr:hypothetical protein [Thermoplasmata archaeon]
MYDIGRTATAGTDEKGDIRVIVGPPEGEIPGPVIRVDAHPLAVPRIESAARAVLSEMGVERATVTMEDHGALDFIVRARLRTAIGRAIGC